MTARRIPAAARRKVLFSYRFYRQIMDFTPWDAISQVRDDAANDYAERMVGSDKSGTAAFELDCFRAARSYRWRTVRGKQWRDSKHPGMTPTEIRAFEDRAHIDRLLAHVDQLKKSMTA